jgi:osmotically-inducible protein OsmY
MACFFSQLGRKAGQTMKAQTVHMTDKMLRDAVIARLDFEPEVDPGGIGVAAEDGVVTITGSVDDYSQKVAAEKAVKRIFGVKGVANELLVRMARERTDTDIAKDAIYLLESDVHFMGGKVMVTVEDGLLTLEGTVEWDFQKVAAEKAMQCIRGVKAVANLIEVAPAASPADIQKKSEVALIRSAEGDPGQIKAAARDQVAVLSGNSRSWSEGEEVERAAWSVAGVVRVGDLVVVEPGVTR